MYLQISNHQRHDDSIRERGKYGCRGCTRGTSRSTALPRKFEKNVPRTLGCKIARRVAEKCPNKFEEVELTRRTFSLQRYIARMLVKISR